MPKDRVKLAEKLTSVMVSQDEKEAIVDLASLSLTEWPNDRLYTSMRARFNNFESRMCKQDVTAWLTFLLHLQSK